MKKLWQKIFLELLYLTPIGYLLSCASLFSGKRTPGVSVILDNYSPIRATVKTNPSPRERIRWFLSGLILLMQGWFLMVRGAQKITTDFGEVYAFAAIIFGAVSLISAFFPCVQWNRKIF